MLKAAPGQDTAAEDPAAVVDSRQEPASDLAGPVSPSGWLCGCWLLVLSFEAWVCF